MASETIYGKFEYKGKVYPFALSDRILTVVQAAYEYKMDFQSEENIGTLTGVTSKNSYITFIGCKRLGGMFYLLSSDIQISLKGYILHDEKICQYDRLLFHSPALNGFYCPRKAWKFQEEDIRKIKSIEMKESKEINQEFSCTVSGENIDCVLGFNNLFLLKPEETQPLDVQSIFTMAFNESKGPDDIGKYYLYLRDFLVFLNFRNDIPIGDITLSRKNEGGKYVKVGKAIIFQHNFDRYKSDISSSITFDDLGIDIILKLFSLVAERRGSNNFNPYIFPENDQDEREIDRAKWLIAAISFEGEFNLNFPDYKYETDESFRKVKDLLFNAITNALAQSGKGINHPSNAALKSFKHLIETSDTTIQEKFAHCESVYATEMTDKVQQICSGADVPFQQSFAEDYAVMRNSTAHGTIQPIQNIDFVTYRILRCFIYLLIMTRANIPSDSMKRIIEKMF